MSLLEGIDLFLEVDVVGGELSLYCADLLTGCVVAGAERELSFPDLVIGLAKLLLGVLKGARRKRRNRRTKVATERKQDMMVS